MDGKTIVGTSKCLDVDNAEKGHDKISLPCRLCLERAIDVAVAQAQEDVRRKERERFVRLVSDYCKVAYTGQMATDLSRAFAFVIYDQRTP